MYLYGYSQSLPVNRRALPKVIPQLPEYVFRSIVVIVDLLVASKVAHLVHLTTKLLVMKIGKCLDNVHLPEGACFTANGYSEMF